MTTPPLSSQFLFSPVTNLKGIGPKTAGLLAKAGIHTVRDLLYYLPRDYQDYTTSAPIVALRPGKVMIRGQISNLKTRPTRRRNFTITEGIISDDTGSLRVVWFNQPYRAKSFEDGAAYYFSGDYDFKYNRYQLTSPTVTPAREIDERATLASSTLQPVYPARGTLKSFWFQKLFSTLRPLFVGLPNLVPPPGPNTKLDRASALFNLHFPTERKVTDQSRRYLAYEELFQLLLAAELNKHEHSQLSAPSLPFLPKQTRKLVASLPFKLTNAQRLATWDILKDLERPTPMNRLLQGDVGSGKTVVAAIAAHQAASNGFQTAILAPTAVLATQHLESLLELLTPFGLRLALLTGATKQKAALKKQISAGEIDIVIGTHALLTDDTIFHRLGLCIIDEQHRFGVAQRQKLLEKSLHSSSLTPHLLSMTATPIPRSLQLTIFGDLDISVLDQLPAGRQPIETKIINPLNLRLDLYPLILDRLRLKQQVYWICPSIDEQSGDGVTSVKTQAKKLEKLFPKAKITFLHGRQKPSEKDTIMREFLEGKIDILVSTTVVEVGVNVPNATVIVIMDADHYGLAQLHQLRGRVGRGKLKSHCFLITSDDQPPTRRLRELAKSTDGFYLAEVDLKLRGAGEIYGSLQHGALDLRIATLSDTKLIALASSAVKTFAKNPENMLKYPELIQSIKKYQQLTTLN